MESKKASSLWRFFAIRGMSAAMISFAALIVIYIGFGIINPVMFNGGCRLATMAQNPDVMGCEDVKAAVNTLNGGSLGSVVTGAGVSVLTKERQNIQTIFFRNAEADSGVPVEFSRKLLYNHNTHP